MRFDAHLDLAYNAVLGRDLTLPLAEFRAGDPVSGETGCVTFDELRRANVGVCLGTLFALPETREHAGYTTWQEARAQAVAQLDVYRRWEDAGQIRLLGSAAELRAHRQALGDRRSQALDERRSGEPLGVILLMENADPLKDAGDLEAWRAAGVRLIGPAWQRNRYAGGTDGPGPLTDRGRELLDAMQELNVTLDAAHLDDESFWEAIERQPQVVCTHANSRHWVQTNRMLSDEMVSAVAERGGVLGLVAHSKFVVGGWEPGQPRASLAQWAAHFRRLARLAGWERLGLGSDLDGGFGLERAPAGIERYGDVWRVLDALDGEEERGEVAVTAQQRAGLEGGHWLRWLEAHL